MDTVDDDARSAVRVPSVFAAGGAVGGTSPRWTGRRRPSVPRSSGRRA